MDLSNIMNNYNYNFGFCIQGGNIIERTNDKCYVFTIWYARERHS